MRSNDGDNKVGPTFGYLSEPGSTRIRSSNSISIVARTESNLSIVHTESEYLLTCEMNSSNSWTGCGTGDICEGATSDAYFAMHAIVRKRMCVA